VTEEAEARPTPEAPAKVVIGAYINDIQELDFKTNSYAIGFAGRGLISPPPRPWSS